MPSAESPHAAIENPWLRAFVSAPWEEIVVGQILVRRAGRAFELHHAADSRGDLKSLRLAEARALANFNETGEFRPLKSTRDLKRGWTMRLDSAEDLGEALQQIYPNALADRFALGQTPPPLTPYREFAARQSGMYRITTFLSDEDVGRVIERTCSAICLKQRLWTVPGTPPDAESAKSIIPCLEPCAIFLEAARKEVRARQEAARITEAA